MENPEAIRHALQDCRREGLTKFMNEFIALLDQEGFTFENLLDAVIDWTLRQGLKEAAKHLENAVSVVQEAHKASPDS